MRNLMVLLCCVLDVALSHAGTTTQTWSDMTGKYSITAKYAGVMASKIRLLTKDDSLYEVPLKKLSEKSQCSSFRRTSAHNWKRNVWSIRAGHTESPRRLLAFRRRE